MFGLEVYDGTGRRTFDTGGDYGRVLDVFNPHSVGVPGSRTYPGYVVDFICRQGNRRVLNVKKSSGSISWAFADSQSWNELSAPASIVVVVL